MNAGIITTYESGVDLVIKWRIENFFNLPDTDDEWYWSPVLSLGSERWILVIYPNGSSEMDSSGHVDLCLGYVSDLFIKLSFSLSLKTVTGEKYNEQHCTIDFDNDKYFHAFNRFITRSELGRRRSELVPEGVLTVVCKMKNTTSARNTSNTASASVECCHCKGTFNADILTSHQKKCLHRPVKCPDCLEVIVLQKWFDEHECQQERTEAGNDPEHVAVGASTRHVEVSTQTVEATIQSVEASILTVEASTQTVEQKCENCASGSSTNPQENKVLHEFKELILNKEDCDVTVKVQNSRHAEQS